jgi:hypothetical protein
MVPISDLTRTSTHVADVPTTDQRQRGKNHLNCDSKRTAAAVQPTIMLACGGASLSLHKALRGPITSTSAIRRDDQRVERCRTVALGMNH